MLLIRPFLKANEKRDHKIHLVIFFIFIISNCSGLLTPMGDPPLFLGFLKGVPFSWTLKNLFQEWLFTNGLLIVIFHFVDSFFLDREEKEKPGSQLEEVMVHAPLVIEGKINIIFLASIVAIILGKGQGWGNDGAPWPFGVQEISMGIMLVLSRLTTPQEIYRSNRFTYSPIVEVAVLFIGIFLTMVSPLLILNREAAQLGLELPWQFFWLSGSLSSFLDNAPTYLTFSAVACGKYGISVEGPQYLADFLNQGPAAVKILQAISCGAVFMGANTYIGNGPNFMVKAIAEENKIKMPSFFGYMLYSVLILIPIFGLVTYIFFRP